MLQMVYSFFNLVGPVARNVLIPVRATQRLSRNVNRADALLEGSKPDSYLKTTAQAPTLGSSGDCASERLSHPA
jgi:hypothetical protein